MWKSVKAYASSSLIVIALVGACGDEKTKSSDDDGGAGASDGACVDYLACLAAAEPASLGPAVELYGSEGSCWSSLGTDGCNQACSGELDTKQQAYPDVTECNPVGLGGNGAGGNGVGGGGAGGGGACALPAVGQTDQGFFLALSTALAATSPIVFQVSVETTSSSANGSQGILLLQPLDAMDRVTPAGAPSAVDFNADSDGTFTTSPADISIASAANPITATDILTEGVTVSGTLCSPATFFLCCTVDGDVVEPIPSPLVGSTFTMVRAQSPAAYPEPPAINCAGDLASPLAE